MKNLKNLGKALTKAEQKEVNGGSMKADFPCTCPGGHVYQVQSIQECWWYCEIH